jgi:hypothetical protein
VTVALYSLMKIFGFMFFTKMTDPFSGAKIIQSFLSEQLFSARKGYKSLVPNVENIMNADIPFYF